MTHRTPTAYEPHVLLLIAILLLASLLAMLALIDPAELREIANAFMLVLP